MPDIDLEAVLSAPLAQVTAQTITVPEDLRRELAAVREQGYARAVEELEAGFSAIGAPVRNHDGQVVAALSLNGPSARLTPERLGEIAPLVIEAAGRVSEQLGYKI